MGLPQSQVISGPAFRRQFVLGPEFSGLLLDWGQHRLGDGLMLSVHPDLPCIETSTGGRTLVVLGFVLDPRDPELGDEAIVQDVLSTTATFDDVLRAFDPLAGRWAAVYIADDGVRVFHDAAGLRQIYHWRDDDGAVWCASQPTLLARLNDLPIDEENLRGMTRDGAIGPDVRHFWPGTGSAVVGVDRLLPNHYLDARTGLVRRYWPHSRIQSVPEDVALEQCATTLTNVIRAAAKRYPLALAVTAGYDSRILLAASRGCVHEMAFYTLKKPGMTTLSPDLRVPRHMLRALGLPHKTIRVHPNSHGTLARTVRETFLPFHRSTADEVQAMAADPPRPGVFVTLNGNVSELGRRIYPRVPMTPESMAHSNKMRDSAYAASQFEAWLREASPAIEAAGMEAWDLFYWEQRLSAWLAVVRTEFDLVEEGVTPYNSRALLECMLGVEPSLRITPDYVFHSRLISHMWPELMDYPFNPPDHLTRLKHRVRTAMGDAVRLVNPSFRRKGT